MRLDSKDTAYNNPRDMSAKLFDKRFVVMAGKGGVGKSTMSAALAICAARRGKRVLVAELGGKEKVARLLGHPHTVGYTPTRVRPNIDVINVQPEPALAEYGLMKLRFQRLYRAVFENALVSSLTRMIPGMNELVLIGKAWHLEQEKDGNRARWDMVIIDAPATGHGISLLVLPHVILETVQSGPLASETRLIRDLLTDQSRTIMNIVTLPEEMPVNEALDLRQQMDDTLRIQPGAVFINRIWPEVFSETTSELLGRASTTHASARELLETGRFFSEKCASQMPHHHRLSLECDLPIVQVTNQFTPTFDTDAIERIADEIDASDSLC